MSEGHGGGGGGGGEASGGGYVASLLAKVGYEVDDHGLHRIHESLERIKHVTELLLGVRIIEGLHTLGERYAGLGESLESAAIQTGLTTDNLQKLQYAAAQNALSSEEMTMGLTRLNRQLFQAQKGSKQAQAVFASLGITPDQLAGFANVEEAFYAVEDGINTLGTQQQKVATIMQLFGRGGAKYLKLIAEGSAGTRELGKRAVEVGAIINHTSIENLAKFEDAMSSLRLVSRNFLANFAGAFIPGITRGIQAVEDFFGKNKKLIVDGIASAAETFTYYSYVAYRVFRVFAELIRRSLYGGEGIGGIIHKFLQGLKDDVFSTIGVVLKELQNAANNGSVQQLVDSMTGLSVAAKEAGKEAFGAIASLFGLFGSEVDTSGLTDANKAAIVLMTTLQTIIDLATLALKSFSYFASGSFGKDLYELVSGAATDINVSMEKRRIGNTAAAGAIGSGLAGGLAAAGAMAGPGGPSVTLATPPASVVAPNVVLNSKVEVTATPGMSEQQLADKMQQSQKKAVREMARDFSSAWLW